MPEDICSSLQLISGGSHLSLTEELSEELHVPFSAAEYTRFADGETHVHIASDVRDVTVCIVQPTSPPVNDHLTWQRIGKTSLCC